MQLCDQYETIPQGTGTHFAFAFQKLCSGVLTRTLFYKVLTIYLKTCPIVDAPKCYPANSLHQTIDFIKHPHEWLLTILSKGHTIHPLAGGKPGNAFVDNMNKWPDERILENGANRLTPLSLNIPTNPGLILYLWLSKISQGNTFIPTNISGCHNKIFPWNNTLNIFVSSND